MGVDEPQLVEELNIYPNPASTLIDIQKPMTTQIYNIKIFNILGQLVREQDYQDTINVVQLSSGLHFIRFETNQGIIHKSVLKQ